jgi:hypothetical protein
MKSLLIIICALVVGLSTASGQIASVFHELYIQDDLLPGTDTYRIYASMQDPIDFVFCVYANSNDGLTLGSTNNVIHNSGTGATTGDDLLSAFCGILQFCSDSFVTIGWASDTEDWQGDPMGPGSSVSVFSIFPDMNTIDDSFGLDPVSPNLNLTTGWWVTSFDSDNANGLPIGPDNRVLLAQVTIDSGEDLVYNLNIEVYNDSDDTNSMLYVGDNGTVDGSDIDGSCLGLQYPKPVECPVTGCTDPDACNYNLSAISDDGSCLYPGCTYAFACNFDPLAGCDDGTCEVISCRGCTYPDALEYDPLATIDDGSCSICQSECPGDLNNDLVVNTTDLLAFLSSFGTTCAP